jgi:glutathione S-transferase
MQPLRLVIGNKNYSSWSMRPWVLMRQLGIAFEEQKLRFDFGANSAFRQAVARVSPAGTVPVLVDNGFSVWDSLAITEYLHEKFPAAGVWPTAAQARARARCVAAEMHSSFGALRSHCPMNIEANLHAIGAKVWAEQETVRKNVARVEGMWAEALQASGGPYLFGAFSAADAMYAPVCMRLRSYGLPISDTTRAHVERISATAAVAAWIADAKAEQDFIAEDEPYRKQR